MKFEQYIATIIAVSSYLTGTVKCLDVTKENSMMAATDCQIVNGRRTCKFNTAKGLKLDETFELKIIDNIGRTIACNKKISKFSNTWYGSCDGDADDLNIITRYDEVDGAELIFGSVHIGSDVCRIYPKIETNETEIVCIPQSSFRREDTPEKSNVEQMLPPERRRQLENSFGFNSTKVIRGCQSTSVHSCTNQTGSRRRLFDDSGKNVDIIVVWTKAAECLNANLAEICTLNAATERNMRGLIDVAVQETNMAFQFSGIFTSLRLVHAYRDPVYVEEGKGNFTRYLYDVTLDGDGDIDSVHDKRALYGADIVALIVGDIEYCGLAFVGTDEPSLDRMFSVTSYDCATGYYSFGHEIGHNFNLFHDRASEGKCDELNTFNYGFKNPNAEFRTILSYDCELDGECGNLPAGECTRIQRYSNSNRDYKYNGKIIGNARNDNARQFNLGLARIAAFFPAIDCESDDECNDQDLTTVDTCNQQNRVCVFSPNGNVPIMSPVMAPVRPTVPVKAPVRPPVPVKVPVRPPVPVKVPVVPVKVPVRPPVPVKAPFRPPVPLKVPVRPPVPVKVPVRPPTPLNVPFRPPVPVKVPVRPSVPVKAPFRPPVPVKVPVRPPVPVKVPVRPPVPVKVPVRPPVPVKVPVRPPVPLKVPVRPPVPVKVPVQPPVPVKAPFRPPVPLKVPVIPPAPVPVPPPVPLKVPVRPPVPVKVPVQPPVPLNVPVRPTVPVVPAPIRIPQDLFDYP